MPFKLPQIKITTFGRGLAFALSLVVASIILTSVITFQQSNKMSRAWEGYNTVTVRKEIILSHIRDLMGYDGMIHHFKNFILRQERYRAATTYKKMLQMSVALTAYQALGLTVQEKTAVEILAETLDKYRLAMVTAERMAADNISAEKIDIAIIINDTPATIALNILDNELASARETSEAKVRATVDSLISFVSVSALITGIFVFALVAGIIWYVRRQLVQPLNALVNAFHRIDPQSPNAMRLPLHGSDNEYELNLVANAGNVFLKTAEDHLIRLEQADYALRSSEEHLRSVVETAVDAIVTIDDMGMIQSFNSAAVNIFNYPVDQVLNQNVNMLMPEPYHSSHDGYLTAYKETGENKIIGTGREVVGRRKNGDHFPMLLAVSQTETAGKIEFTGIIRDISAEKEDETKVRMAKEAVDQANKAKSEFLSSMSHELRTPMNAILGFSQLLDSNPADPLSATQKEYVGMILKSGDLLLELIKQVLELSQIEAGHLDVSMQNTSIGPLIDECLQTLSPRAASRNISLQDNCDDSTVHEIKTDPVRLKQILLNLLSNAVKYNHENGSVAIDCRIMGDDRIRISVSDKGPGIPKSKQKKLFIPFDRLGREAGQIEGTGIGLTITKKLVDALNGRIDFRSTEGEGSTFWVDLPISD
jgi:PAS domain S-box-containing protein